MQKMGNERTDCSFTCSFMKLPGAPLRMRRGQIFYRSKVPAQKNALTRMCGLGVATCSDTLKTGVFHFCKTEPPYLDIA